MQSISMVSRRLIALMLTLSIIVYIAMVPRVVQAQPQKPSQEVLLEKGVELNSNHVNVKVRHLTLPVKFKTPEHTHKGPGPRYVLKGQVEVSEGGETHTYKAGEVFWESGIPMTAENVGSEDVELIVIELLPVE